MTEIERPLVTFALFAYNQEKYIRDAIKAAFAQSYSPLEIILSDDSSSDATFSIIKEMAAEYEGPHKLVLNQNDVNQGLGGHINKVMKLARGDLIVIAAGDDISMPRRSELLCDRWVKSAQAVDLLCSDYISMSENGHDEGRGQGCQLEKMNPIEMARYGHGVIGATAAWTRRLWSTCGDLPRDTMYEDQALPFRAILLGGIGTVDVPLVRYRKGVSTWIARGRADSEEMRRRNAILAKHALNVSKLQLHDAKNFGRLDLTVLIQRRTEEMSLIVAIHVGEKVSVARIIRALVRGARIQPVIRAYLQCIFPRIHDLILWWRQTR